MAAQELGKGNGNVIYHRIGEEPVELPPLPLALRGVIRVSLYALQFFRSLVGLVRKACCKSFRENPHLQARQQLRHSLDLEAVEDSKKVILRLIDENPSFAPRTLIDLLCHNNVLIHLREIMSGGNVLIEDATGEWVKKLAQLEGVRPRHSSHEYQKGKSWGLRTPLFGELLFWVDKQGKLRLQFERHSLRGAYQFLGHTIDFLKYKLEGKQQGPYGSSRYTDAAPLIISL